jgi:type I restriction enzyme S subunit
MELKPGYKKTAVGVIPEDWDVKPLSEVFFFTNGKAHEQFIVDYGRYIVVNSKFISTEGAVRKYSDRNDCPTEQGGILMVMSDLPNGRALAKCFLVDSDDCYAVNQRVCSLKARKDFPGYLFYQLNRNPYFLQFDDGVQQTNLLSSIILVCPVLVPRKYDEQRAIAGALGDVDALLDGLEKLISKKRDLKQAAMQQFLTGRTRLPGFSGKWEVKRLGEVLKVRHGKSQHDVAAGDGMYPILATGGEIGRTNYYLYDKPSVLIGRKGTIDVPQYVATPFWTIDTLFFTEIMNDASAKFIFYKFNTINWRSYNEASGVPSLNASTIEGIEINLPKSDEQAAIAAVLSDMDAELAALEQRLGKTRNLKQGMMQELLTGRTRIV